MKIGIGLPAAIPGVDGERVLEWARKADAGPFSSLAVIDRLVYPNFEPLITLAAAAAVTERVGLMTTILLAPLRNAGVLAKQAATLDAISGGRLTLGLAVGGREDDYRAAPASYQDRGKRFDEQLALMKRIWSGEAAGDGIGPVGPPPSQPGGPELLMGGSSPAALRRVGRWADGYISPGTPESLRPAYDAVEESWEAAGRSGEPRFVGAAYYALGPGAARAGADYLRDYYGFAGPAAELIAQTLLTTPDAVTGAVLEASGVGMDELILWPTVTGLDQVDRLADLVA